MNRAARALRALPIGLAALAFGAASSAASLRYCDRPTTLSAGEKDKLLRFGALVKEQLELSGRSLALISRSGLDLSRFGMRYSHAGFSLRDSLNTPWSVRQLYYACDEQRPRLFDQGIAGFLLGTDDPAIGYVSLVFLPEAETEALQQTTLDNRRALDLLGANYSANAYAFGQRYQNCNQWVIETLAAAWGALTGDQDLRAQAQQWLQQRHYEPTRFEVGRLLMWAGAFVPWLHRDDHPAEDLDDRRFRVSMPASIEAFVRDTVAGATRVEVCHTDRIMVLHRGWESIAPGCVPGADDAVIRFDADRSVVSTKIATAPE